MMKSQQKQQIYLLKTLIALLINTKLTTQQKTIYLILINNLNFSINKYGYLHPTLFDSDCLSKLCLRYGRNTIEYCIDQIVLSAEIYLYTEQDRLLISDFDGTATKNDIGGLYNNYLGKDYLHDGYH